MEEVRSKGVTLAAGLLIINAVAAFMNVGSYVKDWGFSIWLVLVILVHAIATLICAIWMLKLHPFSRKAAIVLTVIALMLLPVCFRAHSTHWSAAGFEKNRETILKTVPPESQAKALEALEKQKAAWVNTVGPAISVITFGADALIKILIIYFLTRRRIKEQFEQVAGECSSEPVCGDAKPKGRAKLITILGWGLIITFTTGMGSNLWTLIAQPVLSAEVGRW